MIKENPEGWERKVLVIGEPKFIRELETKRLKSLNAKDDPLSYNQCNAHLDAGNRLGIKESETTRGRKSLARRGDKNPMFGKKGDKCPHFGKKHSTERRENISKGVGDYAKDRPKKHNENISKALKGNPNVGLKGDKNPGFVGHYISPTGEKFSSSRKAALEAGVTKKTLVSWARNNKNGWSFEPK